MSIISKLAGTLESFFQVGGTAGSGWNLNGAILEAKNAANNALVIVRGLTPVGVTDLVTKAYADALALAGDVTGTASASVVSKVNGTTYPAGGALTTGTIPRVTGAATVAYGALDLTNASAVSGALPVGNQASQTMAGDVGGTTAATVVSKVTGSAGVVNVAATGNVITWAAATTAPGLAQSTQTSDVATNNITLSPQPAFASATGTNRTPGDLIVSLAVPPGGTNPPAFTVQTNGGTMIALGSNPSTTYGTSGLMWLDGTYAGKNVRTPTNCNFEGFSGSSYFNTPVAGGQSNFRFAGTDKHAFSVNGLQVGSATVAFGGGVNVLGISNATTNPSTNPAGGVALYSELTTGHLKNRGSLGAVTTLAPAGSSGAVNSQKQLLDEQVGTCETVSSATPTAALAYTTVSGTGGIMTITVVSRATTTGTGIAVGDTAVATYVVGYKNVAGTVTLSTAGITAVGSGQTTAAALTAPVLTATVATNVITILVTNVALCTVDSQVAANINAA